MPRIPTAPSVAEDADGIGLEDILSFDAFHKQFPNIANESRLRWWVYHRRSNGLEASGALIKRAGRWFIVVPRIKAWLLADAAEAA